MTKEERVSPVQTTYDPDDRGVGWIGFAATMFLVIGLWNIFEGIIAFFRSSFWTASGAHYVISDLRTWAWIITIWGVVEVLAAASISKGGQWGRWLGVAVAVIATIIQLAWLPVYPFWAIIAIAIYILILYALVVYGGRRTAA
jgi:hypothetical protein